MNVAIYGMSYSVLYLYACSCRGYFKLAIERLWVVPFELLTIVPFAGPL